MVDIIEDFNDDLQQEIEALQSTLIAEDELTLQLDQENLVVTAKISPSTASDTSRQYVGLHIKIELDPNNYPNEKGPDKVGFYKVRGLDEAQERELLKVLGTKKNHQFEVKISLISFCF